MKSFLPTIHVSSWNSILISAREVQSWRRRECTVKKHSMGIWFFPWSQLQSTYTSKTEQSRYMMTEMQYSWLCATRNVPSERMESVPWNPRGRQTCTMTNSVLSVLSCSKVKMAFSSLNTICFRAGTLTCSYNLYPWNSWLRMFLTILTAVITSREWS